MKKMLNFFLLFIGALSFSSDSLIAQDYDLERDDDFKVENYWADDADEDWGMEGSSDGKEDWDMEGSSDDFTLGPPAEMEGSAEDDYSDLNVMFDQEADYSHENFDDSEEDLGDEGLAEDVDDNPESSDDLFDEEY